MSSWRRASLCKVLRRNYFLKFGSPSRPNLANLTEITAYNTWEFTKRLFFISSATLCGNLFFFLVTCKIKKNKRLFGQISGVPFRFLSFVCFDFGSLRSCSAGFQVAIGHYVSIAIRTTGFGSSRFRRRPCPQNNYTSHPFANKGAGNTHAIRGLPAARSFFFLLSGLSFVLLFLFFCFFRYRLNFTLVRSVRLGMFLQVVVQRIVCGIRTTVIMASISRLSLYWESSEMT